MAWIQLNIYILSVCSTTCVYGTAELNRSLLLQNNAYQMLASFAILYKTFVQFQHESHLTKPDGMISCHATLKLLTVTQTNDA